MHINELPDLVLAKIFDWTCNGFEGAKIRHYRPEVWRGKLKLLAVCKVYRELALPHVHRTSFIRCISVREGECWKDGAPFDRFSNEDSSSDCTMSDHSTNRSDASVYDSDGLSHRSSYSASSFSDSINLLKGTSSYRLHERLTKKLITRSNLDVVNNHGEHWPQNIQVFIKRYDDSADIISGIMKKVRHCSHFLKKIKKVELIFCLYHSARHLSSVPSNITKVDYLGEEFAQLIPSVEFIKLRGSNFEPGAIRFSRGIIKGYAHQLKGFVYPHVVLEKVDSFSEKLEYAGLTGKGEPTNYIPHICPENLKVLYLDALRGGFNWSSFGDSDDVTTLHISNLKSLRLRANSDTFTGDVADLMWSNTKHKVDYKVLAPKLTNVLIGLYPFALSFLISIYDLKFIPNLSIVMFDSTIDFRGFSLDKCLDFTKIYAREIQKHSFKKHTEKKVNKFIFFLHKLSPDSQIERIIFPVPWFL